MLGGDAIELEHYNGPMGLSRLRKRGTVLIDMNCSNRAILMDKVGLRVL